MQQWRHRKELATDLVLLRGNITRLLLLPPLASRLFLTAEKMFKPFFLCLLAAACMGMLAEASDFYYTTFSSVSPHTQVNWQRGQWMLWKWHYR